MSAGTRNARKRGSIAVIERLWRTLKEHLRAETILPLRHRSFQRELQLVISWSNGGRPHMTLTAATPDEVYFAQRRACRQPRFEPRLGWPRAAPCARPPVLVPFPLGKFRVTPHPNPPPQGGREQERETRGLETALVKGQPGALLELCVDFLGAWRHLPSVKLNRAA